MVELVETKRLSDIRNQTSSRRFPEAELQRIQSAVEGVPESVFLESRAGQEVRLFDDQIADALPDYEYEHAGESGRNPRCKLWRDDGFDHSVDLYNPDERIAIEIEKSERKRVSDDLLKFIKGGKTRKDKRYKIEFGCLIVPVNYGGSGNIYKSAVNELDFMRGLMFVEDVAVLGYRDPRG